MNSDRQPVWLVPLIVSLSFLPIFLVIRSCSMGQQKAIQMANQRVAHATARAANWLEKESRDDNPSKRVAEMIQKELASVLANPDATDTSMGQSLLHEIGERLRVRNAKESAAQLLHKAKEHIAAGRVAEGIAALKQCVAIPNVAARDEASCLLEQARAAVDTQLALKALVALSEGDFDNVRRDGDLQDGLVTYPDLAAIRRRTVLRSVRTAAIQREDIRRAEQKREQRETLMRKIREDQVRMEQEAQEELNRQKDIKVANAENIPGSERSEGDRSQPPEDDSALLSKLEQKQLELQSIVKQQGRGPGAARRSDDNELVRRRNEIQQLIEVCDVRLRVHEQIISPARKSAGQSLVLSNDIIASIIEQLAVAECSEDQTRLRIHILNAALENNPHNPICSELEALRTAVWSKNNDRVVAAAIDMPDQHLDAYLFLTLGTNYGHFSRKEAGVPVELYVAARTLTALLQHYDTEIRRVRPQ